VQSPGSVLVPGVRGPGRIVATVTARRGSALILVAALLAVALSACGSSAPKEAPGTASVVSAPVRVAHTTAGAVGYRVVGAGPPLVLIMGYGLTMEAWDPRLVHALAEHHKVVMFDNSGIGRTKQLPPPVSIDDLANQTSALIAALGLGRPDVLGWSLGGTIAQALAVLHPARVRDLVLCATFPGNKTDVAPPASSAPVNGGDFPADQTKAYDATKAAIKEFPAASPAPALAKAEQSSALSDWDVGHDAAGLKTGQIAAHTLIADGSQDQLDPVANGHTLAGLIHGSQLTLYPDAGHAFLFQDWSSFAALVNSFL
jgi:pimeloyl-ACP methyl ester carboxylesterase